MNSAYVALALFLVLVNNSYSEIISLNDDSEVTIKCDNELCFNEQYSVSAELGYNIIVNVEKVDINAQYGYLLVKAGTNTNDGFNGKIFTHFISNKMQYVSMQNQLFIKFVVIGDIEGVEVGGFTLTVHRYGEAFIPTDLPSTTEGLPTPAPEDSAQYVVNISGPAFVQWLEDPSIIDLFKTKVSQMAILYCTVNSHQIVLADEITADNVLLERIIECPSTWPNSETCVQIIFSLPVRVLNDDSYQLNTAHLELMWTRHSDEFLPPEFHNYDEEEGSKAFALWLIIICITILLFSGVLYIIKKLAHKFSGFHVKRKQTGSETDSVTKQIKYEEFSSLDPHPQQAVPEMFEADAQYFDPDITPH